MSTSTSAAMNLTTPPSQEAPRQDPIRETIDSIVVALILAFVFRAFIVEAFVIPTGSMAPSLYGKHGQHRCSKCGYPFVYGIRDPIVDEKSPTTVLQWGTLFSDRGLLEVNLRCPNCTWEGKGNARLNSRDDPLVADSGDRILVLKWPYDIGGSLLGPQRWDVVVFKNPQDGEVNFIKRLLGLPGEILQIIDGDLYTAPVSSVPKDIVEALNAPPTPLNQPFVPPLTQEQFQRLSRVMKIQRKTRVAQDSLWMQHFDQDFMPKDREPDPLDADFKPPVWAEAEGAQGRAWDASSPVVRFRPADAAVHWLELGGSPIQDEYGYNNVNANLSFTNSLDRERPRYVGDVQVRCVMFPTGSAGDGELTFRLERGPDQFQVRLQNSGRVILERFNRTIRDGFWEELRRAETAPLITGRPYELEFENLDYRVAFRVNGEEVVTTDDAQYAPDLQRLLSAKYQDGLLSRATLSIGGQTFPCELRHLKVMRDVYYRADQMDGGRPGWGTAMNPILLRDAPIDFFCCGDNSPQSKDSRLWTDVCKMLRDRQPPNEYRMGTVPGDQMIGRAFFVYWPSGLRFSRDTMPVIPNVGRMRIIR